MSAAPAPASLMPQTGAMCLLDRVDFWDEARVACTSASHRRADHPLRRDGILAAVHLLEYAAQASAVHAALAAGGTVHETPVRYLASVREVILHVVRFDDLPADLRIDATCLLQMGSRAAYGFRVTADRRLLCEGRLGVASPHGIRS